MDYENILGEGGTGVVAPAATDSPAPQVSFDFGSRDGKADTTTNNSQDIEMIGDAVNGEDDIELSAMPKLPETEDGLAPTMKDADDLENAELVPTTKTEADNLEIPEPEGTVAPTEAAPPEASPARIEVRLPRVSPEQKGEYIQVESDIIESVNREEITEAGQICYYASFTDGREDLLTHDELINHRNGQTALVGYYNGDSMGVLGKRKHHDDDYHSEVESHTSEDNVDVEESSEDSGHRTRRRSKRPRRPRDPPTQQTLLHHQFLTSDNEDEVASTNNTPSHQRRSLRTRKLPQRNANEQDELQDGQHPLEGDEPPMIFSDVMGTKKGRSRPRKAQPLPRSRFSGPPHRKSPDSDIEFEAPRRSARTTRNRLDMRDDAPMDEEPFDDIMEKTSTQPKVISVREVFQPTDPDSPFASVHIDSCHACGESRQRGQLIPCQGCSLAYHKNCLAYRSGRDHMVTKVGDQDFVLQCKYCIGHYKKKDVSAPRYDMCQDCKGSGNACAVFSKKKTARQEEKLREENGGEDPITAVSSVLLNNSELVLFRCVKCHRGWHIEHLPPTGSDSIATDVRSERLKDYSIDWQCNECSSAKHEIHRLVAWRPAENEASLEALQPVPPAFSDFDEDSKEYLIKWEGTSYFHCSWKPGAWVFGVSAPAMRAAFSKRDAERSLLKLTQKEAIPEEFLMPDVILNLMMDSAVPRRKTKEDELNNISHIKKIFVKFQGLGYDDVVWDTPPKESMGKDIYNAFLEAFYDYLEGRHFQHQPSYKIRDRIQAYKNAEFEEVDHQPAGLQRGKLMEYQIEGLNWLLDNYHFGRSVVLADEMGLGKTVQVISLVVSLVQDKPRCWPFLIVVPNATCPNWRREFKQWTPDLRVVTYHGGKASQELAYKYELFPNGTRDMNAHVVIMSYNSAADPQTKTLFRDIHWVGLVVDEGQRLKNDQNLLYGALRDMDVPFRLLLTGTPLQNNKRELFNLLQFIDQSQDAAELDLEYSVLDKETLPKLHERIRPYFLRRTKAGVLKFLPPMAQIILPVTMTVIQEKLSKSIMTKNPQLIKSMFANSKLNKKERGSLNNILVQLRKCLCHPFMYSEAIEERHHDPAVIYRNLVEASAKLILLEIMLPKLKERGHRVLIFSQFLQQLDIVEDFLFGMGYGFRRLDGQISSLEKQRRIDAFNAPGSELFAFLLSTRAGGVGINLATADTVIIMDPDFNPHQDIQALSRAHRIGQKQKVLCFQLVTKDSVEERIMQIGRKKMALDHALIESMDQDELAGDDLESILKHGAQALFDEDYQKEAIHYDSASVDKLLDRTQLEQTRTNDEGSAEAQFSYARVWANDKSSFEDGLGAGEEKTPEPINSSVWDQILAQREEEAQKEADANREILGRGGRRRTAVGSYKTNASHGLAVPEGTGANSSDSSDAYSGAESAGESEDDAAASRKGKRRKTAPTQPKTPASTPTKKQVKKTINTPAQQKPTAKPTPRSKPNLSESKTQARRRAKSSTPTPMTQRSSVAGAQGPTPPKSNQKGRQKDYDQEAKKPHKGQHTPTKGSTKTVNPSLATPAATPPAN